MSTIPAVSSSVTMMLEEESHHWRRSMRPEAAGMLGAECSGLCLVEITGAFAKRLRA